MLMKLFFFTLLLSVGLSLSCGRSAAKGPNGIPLTANTQQGGFDAKAQVVFGRVKEYASTPYKVFYLEDKSDLGKVDIDNLVDATIKKFPGLKIGKDTADSGARVGSAGEKWVEISILKIEQGPKGQMRILVSTYTSGGGHDTNEVTLKRKNKTWEIIKTELKSMS